VNVPSKRLEPEETNLKVIAGSELLVDSTSLVTRWAKSRSLGPLCLFGSPPQDGSRWNNRLINEKVASAETTDAGADDSDGLRALTGVSEQKVGDVCVSESAAGTASET
jgi:hypothetical protein